MTLKENVALTRSTLNRGGARTSRVKRLGIPYQKITGKSIQMPYCNASAGRWGLGWICAWLSWVFYMCEVEISVEDLAYQGAWSKCVVGRFENLTRFAWKTVVDWSWIRLFEAHRQPERGWRIVLIPSVPWLKIKECSFSSTALDHKMERRLSFLVRVYVSIAIWILSFFTRCFLPPDKFFIRCLLPR